MDINHILQSSELQKLDTEVLLAMILTKDRSWLLAHPEYELSEKQLNQWNEFKQRRLQHEPIAHITGIQEFYGRDFIVSPEVLIPRPATEGLIDAAKKFLEEPKSNEVDADTDIIIESHVIQEESPSTILDIGTGSGCIAITLALELGNYKLIATDSSESALSIAQQNSKKREVEIEYICEEHFESIDVQTDPFLVVSNPPYIPEDETLMPDVAQYEPHQALFAGPQGLDCIEIIREKCLSNPNCVGWVFECRTHQRTKSDS